MDQRLLDLENNYDETFDRAKSLENWTDIYLPLKLQHQITDTVKECLNRKGKYMLGIANTLICNQLRERVFKDIGRPDLKERCLEVIRKLQLDSSILTENDKSEINDAKQNYEVKIDGKAPPPLKPLQSSVLNVDVHEHLEEQDQELVESVKT